MIFKNIFVYPKYPENLSRLYLLAGNLWCTWNYEAINLFYRIDAQLFRAVNHNPLRLLLSLPEDRIGELSKDKGFLFDLEKVWEKFQDYIRYDRAKNGGGSELGEDDIVAYFAMEFGLHECIPIYGGGLGILSGDFLKAASDLDLPIVGVGLIYKFGYFTQRINLDGQQEELFVEFENHLLPIRELKCPGDDGACVRMQILGQDLKIKLWQIDVGKTKLILLDTDIEDNPPDLRDITQELYVADKDKRLQQELVLGFGGIKALDLLNIKPKIFHINEGHSAFLVIARLQELMIGQKFSFSEAKLLIRASTVFTTHTPVIAGNEHFKTEMVKKYLEPMVKSAFGGGLSFDELAAYGFIEDNKDNFWLPAFAIRFAKYVNCVSRLHRDVSRKMWASLFPELPTVEIPIDYVTNGVHRSWLSEPFTDMFNRHIGPDYIHCAQDDQFWNKVADIPDEAIWEAHRKNKQSLATFMRRKLADDLAAKGYAQPKIANLTRLLNPEYLTVVFARRFAHYKRATLILKDKERLKKILTSTTRPVQLIFAGKAHPADDVGKDMIKEILDFAKDYQLQDKVIFLENYDMNVARHLVWGADVWLNTPLRENEASGTSGMKAAINGVLNLSVLDGWWPEGYNGKNGWAITAGEFYRHLELQEMAEANQIYDLLEEEITEMFYDRDEFGIPQRWVEMMKQSICSVCRQFNMNRMLIGYVDKLYVPSKKEFERLSQDNYRLQKEATEQAQEILRCWDAVKFTAVAVNADKKDRLVEGDKLDVSCTVDLGQAQPGIFSVELFYMVDGKSRFKVIPMQLHARERTLAHYGCSFVTQGSGLQNINVRMRSANQIVQDMHPQLVRWAE
jgi:starch phosphorylase